MSRTARHPREWLTLGVGLTASLIWASLALRVISMDGDPSTKALFACAALVLVGFASSAVIWTLAAPKRASRPTSDATALAEMEAPFVMLAIASVGLGASAIVDTSTGAWGWALMVGGSLVGGLNLGIAFMRRADQADDRQGPR